jgi:hypothetical protein
MKYVPPVISQATNIYNFLYMEVVLLDKISLFNWRHFDEDACQKI